MFRKKGSLFRRLFFPLAAMLLAGILIMSIAATWFSISNEVEDGVDSLAESINFVDRYLESNSPQSTELDNILFYVSFATKADVFCVDTNLTGDMNITACRCRGVVAHNALTNKLYKNCPHHQNKKSIEEWFKGKILEPLRNDDDKQYGAMSLHIPMVVSTDKDGVKTKFDLQWGLYIAKEDIHTGKTIIATITTDNLRDRLDRLFGMFAIAVPISLLVLYGLISAYVYRFTKPLSQMVVATKNYSKGDFSSRIPIERQDELGELITSFNSMATALSITENSRRAFVANVSHELKTPMTTIGGFIDGIIDGTIPAEKHDYYMNIISSEVKRLSRLVNQMLNLSRIEEGKTQLNPTDFNVCKQLVDTILTFEKRIEDKGIGITGLDTLDAVYLYADEDMIKQVIYNLVENAIKFTPQNGRIDFSVEETDKDVSLTIGNTGEGIASELLPRIFERFYKVDASRNYDKKGAGLGLYLVKTLVELHDGQVSVSSTEGEYTQFKFTIPKNKTRKIRGENNG